jgi:hypothetical protein
MNRLISMMLAATLAMGCITFSWAEESPPPPEQIQTAQQGPTGGDVAAAVVADFFYIPGKTAVCATSGVLWTAAMALTAGMLYKDAGDFVHDCCAGKWVLTGEEFMGPEDNEPEAKD